MLCAARIDELADSYEPAMNNWPVSHREETIGEDARIPVTDMQGGVQIS